MEGKEGKAADDARGIIVEGPHGNVNGGATSIKYGTPLMLQSVPKRRSRAPLVWVTRGASSVLVAEERGNETSIMTFHGRNGSQEDILGTPILSGSTVSLMVNTRGGCYLGTPGSSSRISWCTPPPPLPPDGEEKDDDTTSAGGGGGGGGGGDGGSGSGGDGEGAGGTGAGGAFQSKVEAAEAAAAARAAALRGGGGGTTGGADKDRGRDRGKRGDADDTSTAAAWASDTGANWVIVRGDDGAAAAAGAGAGAGAEGGQGAPLQFGDLVYIEAQPSISRRRSASAGELSSASSRRGSTTRTRYIGHVNALGASGTVNGLGRRRTAYRVVAPSLAFLVKLKKESAATGVGGRLLDARLGRSTKKKEVRGER